MDHLNNSNVTHNFDLTRIVYKKNILIIYYLKIIISEILIQNNVNDNIFMFVHMISHSFYDTTIFHKQLL